ncbi:hypothetical protein AVEN_244032-1 [Araneus ventricosus]|uniref:Uncharacterized protein n=1 Tax=Araneus ventricosus TaxID=182803 RepID=A0A4Y2RJZ8_ARAVE|nr:hypothetical protein AVEN_244032-1 [Araneus ventricosus]
MSFGSKTPDLRCISKDMTKNLLKQKYLVEGNRPEFICFIFNVAKEINYENAIFAGAKKCDLKILAEELGETVNDSHKLKDLKKIILASKEYYEESAKEWLNAIINERKKREENEIRKEEIAEQKRQNKWLNRKGKKKWLNGSGRRNKNTRNGSGRRNKKFQNEGTKQKLN